MNDEEFLRYLAECPSDDEAISSEEDTFIKAAQSEMAENKVVSFDEIKRTLCT